MRCLGRGNSNRVVAAMKMNARSSRSHAIFTISLTEMGDQPSGAIEVGRLNLVDLAGLPTLI